MNEKTIIGPVWVTKHALTSPIQRFEQVRLSDGGGVYWYQNGSSWMYSAIGEGREWHRTEEAAHARVKVMAEAKIKSLDKSRAKAMQRLEVGARVVVTAGRPA